MGSRGVETETALQAISALLALEPSRSQQIQLDYLNSKGKELLHFKTFDILMYRDVWLMELPLIKRREYLKKALEELKEANIPSSLPDSNISNKRGFYTALIKSGKEGAVAKRLDSPYIASNSRRRDCWVKIKKTASQSSVLDGYGDTIDAFVTGYEEADKDKSWAGLVGAIEFSVYLNKEDGSKEVHKIARITNIPMQMRKEITEVDSDGRVSLKKEVYGKVAEIDGQCISGRAKRLKHAILLRWRDDKNSDMCEMDEVFLNKMIV